jgi:hypothetical protein
MEVNFGTDNQGFGDVEQKNPESRQSQPKQAAITPVNEEKQDDSPKESSSEKIVRGDEDVKISPAKSDAPAKATPVASAPSESKAPAKTPSSESLFPSSGGASANNGNKPGTSGDMGKRNGNPDARGIYDGSPGSGKGGSSLDMAGWKWDSPPKVSDNTSVVGKIVFSIRVGEDGNVEGVTVVEKTVDATIVSLYRKKVEALTFSRTKGGSNGQGASGRITFILNGK